MENSVLKRVTNDLYEDNGRKFKLKSFDPIEGNFILTQVVSFVLPFGIGDALSSMVGEGSEMKSRKARTDMPRMSKDEFTALMKDILMTVEEVYEGGNTSPVVRENGTYGIANFSMSLAIKLVIASLAFNFKSFFEEVPLAKELMDI